MSAAWVLALSRLSVVDWLLSAGLWVGYGVVENQVMPYHPEIAVNQTTGVPIGLNYPLRTETVSTIELGLYSLLLPALVILASNIIRPRNRWQTLAETSAALCGLSLATSATLLLSAVLKVTVGHPRPSFADRCGWNNSTRTCTASFDDIKEAYSSFPSSHASLAFSGLVYLILALAYIWLPRKISSPYEDPEAPQSPHSSDRTLAATETYVSSFQAVRARWYSTLVSALFVSPLCLACYISVTRVVENMHFTQDILAGAIIGTGLAFWAAGCKLTGVWVTLIQSGMGLGSRETEFHLDRFAI